MPRDILSEYGRDIPKPQAARATSGGVEQAKPISNYATPQGPTNIGDAKSPGIHGSNHGTAHCPVASRGSGGPGLGGSNHRGGSQRG